jgi:hypothetical protein
MSLAPMRTTRWFARRAGDVFNFSDGGAYRRLSRGNNRVRAKSNFASRFNLIGSSSPKVKNILLPFFRKCGWVPPSRLAKGRIAIVTNVEWDAVDASSATDERGLLAYGEAVWSWRPDAGAKFATALNASRRWRGQESPVPGESAEETARPLRGECRMIPVRPLWILVRILKLLSAHEAAGALGTGIPRALFDEGDEISGKPWARIAPRDREVVFNRSRTWSQRCLKFESATAPHSRRPDESQDP